MCGMLMDQLEKYFNLYLYYNSYFCSIYKIYLYFHLYPYQYFCTIVSLMLFDVRYCDGSIGKIFWSVFVLYSNSYLCSDFYLYLDLFLSILISCEEKSDGVRCEIWWWINWRNIKQPPLFPPSPSNLVISSCIFAEMPFLSKNLYFLPSEEEKYKQH